MQEIKLKPLKLELKSLLRSLGYFNIEFGKNKKSDFSFEMIADGTLRSIYLEVRVSIGSKKKIRLSESEINLIKSKAYAKEKEPWVAIVSVNDSSSLEHSIKWKDLSNVE